MGWILLGDGLHRDSSILQRYAPDLSRDPFHVWLSSWHWLTNVVVGLFLLVVGGWPYVFWGIFFRTTWGLHSTWLVNSATHLWGSRRFATRDDSTNNWWVALLTFGEGWHNNHHAHPVSARHGLAWYELDLNYISIRTLEALGLVWDVKTARLTDNRTTEDTRAAARYERAPVQTAPAPVALAAAAPITGSGSQGVPAGTAEREEALEFA
jgi:stearoyl-CoA desaturase (delta-9 desaturase)